eukprot:CAMPEP_0181337548 /NCGR_PEP_ID=MMETSP1101-20121128/28083_1 /TAXON_ID=46948 /ORGANISM="Rhodomonas abbreviata, Strain Caron Lab Isolate" /LENGTH=952 /DNA_ID=CAMNT_0023448061 /DNA_START=124 /DNA_END=2982 /DNA_ORIENTATION=+
MQLPTWAWVVWIAVQAYAFYYACGEAYDIRLYAVKEYGKIIHEFDPWFNFRATKYLADNGWTEFFHWYDTKSWYPIGRPVGTTIYPGMQITSVCIWKVLAMMGEPFKMSLNDVCCMVPAWFGVVATTFLSLLTMECAGFAAAGAAAALVMSIIPAHIMRSVAGGYDNESIAVSAMCMTFFFWCRSLRNDNSWWIGAVAGLAYIYMVMVWGGYIFVVNLIGIHAAFLVATGSYSTKLYRAYTLFFIIGTAGATRVPVVGWAPLRSLEQLGPCLVFFVLQLLEVAEVLRRRKEKQTKQEMSFKEMTQLRVTIFVAFAAALTPVVLLLIPTGYFGPLSARVRGLFVKHTRTGNPLVDSVAEHQPASQQAYWQYLHYMCYCAPPGMVLVGLRSSAIYNVITSQLGAGEWWGRRGEAKSFLVLYGFIAYFFSTKMVRLVLLMAPISSALGGVFLGSIAEWIALQVLVVVPTAELEAGEEGSEAKEEKKEEKKDAKKEEKKAEKVKTVKRARIGLSDKTKAELASLYDKVAGVLWTLYQLVPVRLARLVLAAYLCYAVRPYAAEFNEYCRRLAQGMSNPSIVYKAQLNNGQTIILNDYLDAYFWLRDKTPKDARVMAWWDYGYQITGISDRTTIADGNTWNHEHIATLGKMFASPEEESHDLVRHLADYVLVWTGGGGDDLAKSPHMARIGNSVYPGLCPGDPTCRLFGFMDRQGTPTPMMARSMLYKLIMHGRKQGVVANETMWREVYSSKYQKVRIFKVLKVSKKSRNWLADPANRICDAPGSWYCVGQYPPPLMDLINSRVSFKQLEDFNRGGGDSEYTRQYMQRMGGESMSNEDREAMLEMYRAYAPRSKAEARWEDTELTTHLWNTIKANDMEGMRALVRAAPTVVHTRSSDGRGPLWWAYEQGKTEMRNLLKASGADELAVDARGIKASDLDTSPPQPKKKKKKSKKKKEEM